MNNRYVVKEQVHGFGVFVNEPDDMEENGHHPTPALLSNIVPEASAKNIADALDDAFDKGRADAFSDLRKLIGCDGIMGRSR